MLICCEQTQKYIYIYSPRWHMQLKSLIKEENDPFLLFGEWMTCGPFY